MMRIVNEYGEPIDDEFFEEEQTCLDCPLYDQENFNCPRFNKVIPNTIEELKQNRWTPVSERLPEEPFLCAVTIEEYNSWTHKTERRVLDFAVEYDAEDERWFFGYDRTANVDVIAWRKWDDEPYKGGER